ncbi:hypothetical protein A2865_00160 [Candidatus Woesebacteria bacterium RIFCSPHIGHO2_01_FULL_39_17]|uniref:DUF2905 domain-containing protein n=1 Tax=Candidatus Woesebacteria bacterium RIFCSPLOWO2_01_FULL_39_14 TaxID=1802518 RepID=A0A1F8BN30_9BACT|nr:MAG: hypothetical protein A2865_00160 [Candidatus Woesebacteria bacterium RIFCSPHIGHO2_01_FULL_39_17]OGM65467.1 MAG: hypothetical protein A3A52_00900 [Candidatus Woesebacteria bacterium RIFCSPLOWO2_01_FULL_39_14]
MSALEFFFVLYFICTAFIYAIQRRGAIPFTLPGDIYIHIGQKRIYIPLGSSLIASIILFLILNRFRR